jgi:hypothetical protein
MSIVESGSSSQEEIDACLASTSKKEKIDYNTDWIVDSGCSHHLTGDMSKFMKLQKYEGSCDRG